MSPRLRNMLLSSALMLAAVVLVGRLDSEGAIPSHLPLASFPDRIGNWTGVRLPMDKKTRSLLNADGYASVLYTDRPGDPGLLFFSVYYDRQTAEKNIHSPANCLPSSGWAILSHKIVSLPVNGRGLPPVDVNYNVIQKGLEKQLVLYWYQERGHLFANEYRGRIYLIEDALLLHRTDGALVRVSMPVRGSIRQTFRKEVHFLENLSPLLDRYIPGSSRPVEMAARSGQSDLAGGSHP
ncbi:exosortase C-terminal domain/associated protein EpsI [Leptospirillum ferriphilum]|uniref:exosortase C-terminal domain/associated protein EpsI n=1 Tax=Leptospirillum ferriphilum TaxID=178606 RepID=UPI000A6CA9A9|nr:exosortase C-terminal domain/associated protein EpsI [Leptospirillum ferriphilum]